MQEKELKISQRKKSERKENGHRNSGRATGKGSEVNGG